MKKELKYTKSTTVFDATLVRQHFGEYVRIDGRMFQINNYNLEDVKKRVVEYGCINTYILSEIISK